MFPIPKDFIFIISRKFKCLNTLLLYDQLLAKVHSHYPLRWRLMSGDVCIAVDSLHSWAMLVVA